MKRTLLFITISILGLAACNRSELTPARRSLSVEAGIDEMTKVATNGNEAAFEAGDKISVYAWTGSAAAVPETRAVDGAVNTLGADGKWTPASPMLWANLVDEHYFLGISPARTVSDFSADAYLLNPDDYTGSDLLVATSLAGLKAQEDPVSLSFSHVLARLDVNLTFRNQWESTPAVTEVTATAKKTALVDYLTKKLTATGDPAAVAIPGSGEAWSGLQVPQTGVREITVVIDGKNYVFSHTEDIPLAGGKYTTVNLVIGRDRIELASPITISPWTSQGGAIDGDVYKPNA